MLNASGLVLPDGSGRPLRLRLTSKDQISVRINDTRENLTNQEAPENFRNRRN